MTDLEKLARQLEIIGMSGYGMMNVDFDVLAKHVQSLILEARIEEIGIVRDIPGKNLYIFDRITQLQQELRKCE